jgi:AbrB family looped-hinge helix DNA binding protein
VARFTGLNSVRFSAKLDSKGRITVPADIRNRLNLEKDDEIPLVLGSDNFVRKKFSSDAEALNFLSGLENVKSFRFDGEVLEAILDE